MSEKDLDPSGAQKVRVAEQLIHSRAKTANVSASDDLEAFFGSALAKAPRPSRPCLAMNCRWARAFAKTGSLRPAFFAFAVVALNQRP